MMEAHQNSFGNPSSLHSFGREARERLDHARDLIASAIGAEPQELLFTSSGTEADNLALVGFALANSSKGKHIITSRFEHHAVLEPAKFLEGNGFELTYLPVSGEGFVDPDSLRKAIRKDTILISIMSSNNEIGTVQAYEEIAEIARQHGITFHSDCVQSLGQIDLRMDRVPIDMASFSGHKVYGPKGVGVLFVREGTKLHPLIMGGGQEFGIRAGTENFAGIVCMGRAVELAVQEREENSAKISTLRDRFVEAVLSSIPDCRYNGSRDRRLPANANITFIGAEGELVLLNLDLKGIAASAGSACTSGTVEPSHVLQSIGLTQADALSSIRFSFGKFNTEDDLGYTLEVLPGIIEKVRAIT